jgi:hypothetical protein
VPDEVLHREGEIGLAGIEHLEGVVVALRESLLGHQQWILNVAVGLQVGELGLRDSAAL